MKLSANQFAQMIKGFGYPVEASKVQTFLKGIGEYDFGTKQYYFTMRSLHKYREMMIEKTPKDKYEVDFDFHEFFFKSISNNDQEITERDLDLMIADHGLTGEYALQCEKIIQRTEGLGSATSISF